MHQVSSLTEKKKNKEKTPSILKAKKQINVKKILP